MRIFPIALAFAFATFAGAQQDQETVAAATKACAAVKDNPVPTLTPRSDDERKWLSVGCAKDSEDQYNNAGCAQDFIQARGCALGALASYKDGSDLLQDQEDLATLVVIYANGDGVPRNVGLAVHFLCMGVSSIAPAVHRDLSEEGAKLIVELQKSNSDASPRRYTLCSVGVALELDRSIDFGCAEDHYKDLQDKRLAHLTELASHWTKAQRDAFNAAIKAHDAYADANQNAEASSGTGVGYTLLDAMDDINKEFATDIDRFEQGSLPRFTHQEYLDADKKLNAQYRALMEDKGPYAATFPRTNVINAERAWLVYRDAFVAFAKLRWPNVSADTWLTFLTKERIERFSKIGLEY